MNAAASGLSGTDTAAILLYSLIVYNSLMNLPARKNRIIEIGTFFSDPFL